MTGFAPAPPVARVAPGAPPARWEVRVPGSKSITNRALLLAGVAVGTSRLEGVLRSEDTEAMARALGELGATVAVDGDGGAIVDGLGGPPSGEAAVDCRQAGTVARFLVPMLAAGTGRVAVDGHAQLRRRPLGPVLDALRAQGTVIDGERLPLTITSRGLRGGEVDVDASVSSQFLSGLLMAAPFAASPTTLRFGTLVSAPYVRLTVDAMAAFGVAVRPTGADSLEVPAAPYRCTDFRIEPDVSTASYFLASAALTGTTVTLPGLDLDVTRQGDVELVDHLVAMGCAVEQRAPLTLRGPERLRGVQVDMNASSDVFMTLACIAPFADGPTTITGIGHARVKESDRVGAVAANLRELGIAVEEGPDWLRVHPGSPRAEVLLPTFDDHRIAMAFALIGAAVPVELDDPGVVAKTCPDFFTLWTATGADVRVGS